MQNPNAPIINVLPLAALLLAIPMVAAELYFVGTSAGLWGNIGSRFEILNQTAYASKIFEGSWSAGQMDLTVWGRFFTYSFFNASFLGAAFGIALTLALAKFVAEALGNIQTIAIYLGSAAVAAFLYGVILPQDVFLIGATVGVFGLLGAFTFVQFSVASGVGDQKIKAFQIVGILLTINIMFSLAFGGGTDWVAQLFAAAIGFGCATLLQPRGFAIVLHNIRRR